MTTSPLASTTLPSIPELTNNAARWLQQSLSLAQQTANPATLTATDLALARSNVQALAFVQGTGLHGAYRYLRDFIARQAVPIYAVGEFLDGWLATYGLVRKPAVAAAGLVQGTGVADAVLSAGVLLQASNGQTYRVTTSITVPVGGVVQAQVLAVIPGVAGELGAAATLSLISPVTGIDSPFSTTAGISGGADSETDDQAIYRLQQRLSNEPMGGSPADYARWALEVPGITRAWGVRNPSGATTAGVIIMADANTNGLATSIQQGAVYTYITDPKRGPPDELFVIIPTLVPVNITVHLTPDSAAIRAAVMAALQDVFYREGLPGGSIPQSHIVEAISTTVGEYNHTISSPAITSGAFFTVGGFSELLTLGTITFA
jgi:uncharacterized phage protein gp47/JayE